MTAACDPERYAALVRQAVEARKRAYAPYSGFPVGAALLTKSGRVYTAANVENAVYGLSVCAERNAIFQAVVDGEREFEAIAIAAGQGATPCGPCRQVMREFADDRLCVLVADETGNLHGVYTLAELLPQAFTGEDLSSVG